MRPPGASRARTLAGAGLATLAALVLAACGSQSTSQRPAVARYIRSAQTIENALSAPLAAVTRAGAQLASAPHRTTLLGNLERAGNEQVLATSLHSLKLAQARLVALHTPPPPAICAHCCSL